VSPAADERAATSRKPVEILRQATCLIVRRMMNGLRPLVGPVVLLSLAVGCADSASVATSPSPAGGSPALTAEQVEGAWRVLSIQATDQDEQATPAGATYTLNLAGGRLSTLADCNTCSGTFAISGQTLTAGPALACTLAACPTMAFERAYTALLSGDSTVSFSGGTFVLSSPRGVLRFAR
jgi:heat shock protein HslJ